MKGKLRRISGEWSLHDTQTRDTLVPCQACKGNGSILVETPTTYTGKVCRWCNGIGGVTKRIANAFIRWQRIYAVNKQAGRCG